MRRNLGDGFELDDDRGRVDAGAVHRFLAEARGRGLGVELVRAAVDDGPFTQLRWILHTADAHGLYARFGFGPPDDPALMVRPPRPLATDR